MNFKTMMLGAVSAAAMMAVAGTAQAEPAKPGTYVSFGAGMSWIDDLDDSGAKAEFDDGYTLRGAVGYDSGDVSDLGKYRVEAELSYTENDGDSGSALGVTLPINGNVEQLGIMANFYWDFIPGGSLRPYIGVGLGAVDTEVDVTVGGINVTGSETEVAYQGMLGLTYHMNQNWALDVGYRHTRVEYDETLENNAVTASVRYSF